MLEVRSQGVAKCRRLEEKGVNQAVSEVRSQRDQVMLEVRGQGVEKCWRSEIKGVKQCWRSEKVRGQGLKMDISEVKEVKQCSKRNSVLPGAYRIQSRVSLVAGFYEDEGGQTAGQHRSWSH